MSEEVPFPLKATVHVGTLPVGSQFKSAGITPKPEYQFHGLKPGKKGCLGALRWQKAFEAECAPKVELKASDKKALQHININDFILHAKK